MKPMLIRSCLIVGTGVCCAFSSGAMAETLLTPDLITGLKTHTSTHAAVSARNIGMISVTPEALTGGCTEGVWFDEELDKTTQAIVMVAFTTSRSLKITYDSSVKAPWGSTTICGLTGVEIVR